METNGFRVQGDPAGRQTVIIPFVGELDVYAAPEVKGQLLAAIEQGAQRIVVDLNSASFIDSTILGAMLSAAKRLRAVDGELAIVCTNTSILKLFEITLLDRVFSVYDDCGHALGPDSPSEGRAEPSLLQSVR